MVNKPPGYTYLPREVEILAPFSTVVQPFVPLVPCKFFSCTVTRQATSAHLLRERPEPDSVLSTLFT